jgi:hypothetical protein
VGCGRVHRIGKCSRRFKISQLGTDPFQAWVGSVTSTLTTCDDLKKEFNEGQCGGTRSEDQRTIFSLYFAYSLDVATDLASM